MCENCNNKEELLDKLKEEWENETHSGNTHPSDSNKTLNTDVSIQIHMDNPKPINEFSNMDTILDDLDKPFNEPYYLKLFKLKNINYWKRIEYNNILLFVLLLLILLLIVILLEVVINSITINFISDNSTLKI
ncbi:hypothetical protein PFHG_05540 [Plasmodium falciparum HB3]|uniref:Plasmodium falciparum erythrocyte membrane protein 1 acidic terminal segment domain-containing protein n=1 Tax=Plasmodium falciparum (isolate HB3) TaxID=137071 RepID=A0A0L7KLM0_PLAFX|nr:hypothetical protein PFHG_05540 [Plasmodium falciparum HB3]